MLVPEDILATYGILDHIPLGACILREDYVVLFWNSTLETWTNIPRDQIIGTDIRQTYALLQEAKFKIRLESIFKGGPPAIFSSLLHTHVIPSTLWDGSPRIQHTTVTCLPTVEGDGFHALLSMQVGLTQLNQPNTQNRLKTRLCHPEKRQFWLFLGQLRKS